MWGFTNYIVEAPLAQAPLAQAPLVQAPLAQAPLTISSGPYGSGPFGSRPLWLRLLWSGPFDSGPFGQAPLTPSLLKGIWRNKKLLNTNQNYNRYKRFFFAGPTKKTKFDRVSHWESWEVILQCGTPCFCKSCCMCQFRQLLRCKKLSFQLCTKCTALCESANFRTAYRRQWDVAYSVS